MTAVHISLIAIFAATLLLRDVYELGKLTGRADPTSKTVFAAVFASMLLMWGSWFAIGLTAPALLAAPAALRWAGLAVVVAGVFVALAGMWTLRGVENIDHLVTRGVFSKIRHPMYLGFAAWILGWCAFSGAPANLALAPFGLASILWWRQLEERDLAARYGEEYATYRETTWA